MRKYIILKGWHYAFFFFRRIFGWYYNKKRYYIRFKLSKECWWKLRNNDDLDLNKMIGLSFGFKLHRNSVRLSWTPNFEKDGYVNIYGYVYDASKKEHQSKFICEVEVDKEYLCLININEKSYIFDMFPFGIITMENKTIDSKLQKIIYPYFGGNNTSPQKMELLVSIKSS